MPRSNKKIKKLIYKGDKYGSFGTTFGFFTEKVQEMMEAGISIIGDCCSTTPEHIRAMRKVIDSL